MIEVMIVLPVVSCFELGEVVVVGGIPATICRKCASSGCKAVVSRFGNVVTAVEVVVLDVIGEVGVVVGSFLVAVVVEVSI